MLVSSGGVDVKEREPIVVMREHLARWKRFRAGFFMAVVNLGDLVKGLWPIVLFAWSIGHLGEIQKWAAREAFTPSQSKPFFSHEYQALLSSIKLVRPERQSPIRPKH